MKQYSGILHVRKTEVRVHENGDSHILDIEPSLKVWAHSPTGFDWGYGGSGPSQLALAILLDFTGDEAVARARYMEFKWTFIANLDPSRSWEIVGDQIEAWLQGESKHEVT